MRTNIFLLLLSIFFVHNSFGAAYCAESANQTGNASLPQVLEIQKIIVTLSDYDIDQELSDMGISSITHPNPNASIYELLPIQVKIHTNLNTPISVGINFTQLDHVDGGYSFNPSALTMVPASRIINNPYDGVISDPFVPFINVGAAAISGNYRGVVVISLGAL